MELKVLGDKPKLNQHTRFVSIDFARGLAIFIMIILHIINTVLGIDEMITNVNDIPIFNLLAMIILPFYGGLAGLFLLVSSIGNTISFFKDLNKNKSVKSIVFKQVASGVLLLLFAMVTEGLLSQNALVGSFFGNLDDLSNFSWASILYRFNHFETVHTIAWCLIINGCIQGLLSLKGNWKNTRQLIITYALLAVAVLALTQPIWDLINYIIPGYPFGTGNSIANPMPIIGTHPFWTFLVAPFLSALAAPVEPLFPYLAVSFFGSIVGIVLSQPKEKISKMFPRKMFLIGLGMFIVGLIGVIAVVVKIFIQQGLDAALEAYQIISFHRHWSSDWQPYIPFLSWLWQFLALNGLSIMILMMVFRLVEFRGRSQIFANRTKFFRRFGTIAFTNYAIQSLYVLVFFVVSFALTNIPYNKVGWGGTILTVAISIAIYHVILWSWEKINYIGSLEWFNKTIAASFIKLRKDNFEKDTKWWQKGQIDVEKTFYFPEWVDIVEGSKNENESDESLTTNENSKLAFKLSLVGLCSIVFIGVSIISIFASLQAQKTDGVTKKNKTALVLSIIGTAIFVGFIIASFFVPIGAIITF